MWLDGHITFFCKKNPYYCITGWNIQDFVQNQHLIQWYKKWSITYNRVQQRSWITIRWWFYCDLVPQNIVVYEWILFFISNEYTWQYSCVYIYKNIYIFSWLFFFYLGWRNWEKSSNSWFLLLVSLTTNKLKPEPKQWTGYVWVWPGELLSAQGRSGPSTAGPSPTAGSCGRPRGSWWSWAARW